MQYHAAAATPASARDDALLASGSTLDDADRYKDCHPLRLTCPGCQATFAFGGVAALLNMTPQPAATSPIVVKTEAASPTSVLKGGAPASPSSPSMAGGEKAQPLDVLACPECGNRTVTPAVLANQVRLRLFSQCPFVCT